MLQASLGYELYAGRTRARDEGRERLEDELDRVLPVAVTTADLDAAAAFVASSGLTAAWGAAALAAIAAGSTLSRTPKAIEPSVQRTVSTEVARAFNDERERLLIDLGEMGGMGGLDTGRIDTRSPGMFKVFSAFLDGKTCPRCFEADGETVELHKAFKSGTAPLHPHCRCTVEHIIIPKPDRLDDVAIDYELFKAELRDIIREKREESAQHALGFVADSMGRGKSRSPKALTKRFANEDYVRRSP